MSRSASEAPLRGLASRLRDWFWAFWEAGDALAEERALTLLKEHLSSTQREQYEREEAFDVIGGRSGSRYRISLGYHMTVEHLDRTGRRFRMLCFAPKGRLAIGDIMLAQKLALELYEEDVIVVANKIAASTILQSAAHRGVSPSS
jgi:ribulose bisphosphate carboxylase small subunit